MSTVEAAIALNRFGLGARPGEAARIAADPRGWLKAQLGPAGVPAAGLPSSAALVAAQVAARRDRKAVADPAMALRKAGHDTYLQEAVWRERRAVATDRPFAERLVRFWGNHFTVSIRKGPVLALAGVFEREAVRPHVAGRFADLATAATLHPAMLLYLDNAQSIGPHSPAARRVGRGLNENLGRELLELHTLGVDGGYGQADVQALALILSGWSIGREAGRAADFFPARHEPGEKLLLGRRYAEAGGAEATRAIADLARHPATAKHVASKLARHFVADAPPAGLVARLQQAFARSDGDLSALAVALVDAPEAWEASPRKLKTPAELLISAVRATGLELPDQRLLNSLRQLGQMPFDAASPAGWPDLAADWAGPEAVVERVEWCAGIARFAAPAGAPAALLADLLGPRVREATRDAVARAANPAEGLALLLASPEFQRR